MLKIPDHIRGLIFDCDGTIADTMPMHYRAWSAAFAEHNHTFPESMFYGFAGMPTIRIIQTLNEKHGYTLPVQATASRKEQLFEEMIHEVLPIKPVVALVYKYEGKMPMAVASGGTYKLVSKTLAALNLLDKFQAVVTADDVKHGKPAPDIFLEAARRLNVPATDCAAFEDGEMGLQSARAAGMYVVDVRPITGNP